MRATVAMIELAVVLLSVVAIVDAFLVALQDVDLERRRLDR